MKVSPQHFPFLTGDNHTDTSPRTRLYNCIAYAAGDTKRWWDPLEASGNYWPDGVTRALTIDAFVSAYETVGFEPCEDATPEAGWEKIAIFASGGRVTHAARLLTDGKWTSKMGGDVDIVHETATDVGGGDYGFPAKYMRRPVAAPDN